MKIYSSGQEVKHGDVCTVKHPTYLDLYYIREISSIFFVYNLTSTKKTKMEFKLIPRSGNYKSRFMLVLREHDLHTLLEKFNELATEKINNVPDYGKLVDIWTR